MKDKLNKYGGNVTSQHGEDGILAYIISVLGNKMHRVACEFGAWDGVFASNIYDLWYNKGWRAILIEGDESKCRALMENAKGFDVKAIHEFVAISGEKSIDEIFRRKGIDPNLGILSIDIDSFDYHVWKHTTYVNPQVVVIEFNQNVPPHLDYFDPEDTVYLKCSAKALERLGAEKGYRLVCCTLVNAIFVREDLFDSTKFPDMPVEWLFDYTDLKPQVIFTGENGNMYPVFSKRSRNSIKLWWKIYYWVTALPKKRRCFRRPPRAVVEQIRRAGLDV